MLLMMTAVHVCGKLVPTTYQVNKKAGYYVV